MIYLKVIFLVFLVLKMLQIILNISEWFSLYKSVESKKTKTR